MTDYVQRSPELIVISEKSGPWGALVWSESALPAAVVAGIMD
jgi:hypothetical protein